MSTMWAMCGCGWRIWAHYDDGVNIWWTKRTKRGTLHHFQERKSVIFYSRSTWYCIRRLLLQGPRGWMDNVVFSSNFHEGRAIEKGSEGRKRISYVDNCSGHRITEEVNNPWRSLTRNFASCQQTLPTKFNHLINSLFLRLRTPTRYDGRNIWHTKYRMVPGWVLQMGQVEG